MNHSLKNKCFFLLFCIAASFTGNAQSEFDKKIAATVCTCIENSKNEFDSAFAFCMAQAMEVHEDLVLQEMQAQKIDSTEEAGYKWGQQIFNRISVSLIYDCDVYFRLMDSIMQSALTIKNKDEVIEEMKLFHAVGPNKRDFEYFIQRGAAQLQLNQYDAALQDFDSSLAKTDPNLGALFFKAITLERLYRFDEAIELFATLVALTGTREMKILYALAKRRKALHLQK